MQTKYDKGLGQGVSGMFDKKWQPRYFRLSGHYLNYSADEKTRKSSRVRAT
jgi:hypothetical protein